MRRRAVRDCHAAARQRCGTPATIHGTLRREQVRVDRLQPSACAGSELDDEHHRRARMGSAAVVVVDRKRRALGQVRPLLSRPSSASCSPLTTPCPASPPRHGPRPHHRRFVVHWPAHDPQALLQGYRVRTTIRSEAKKSLILAALREYDESVDASGVEFAHANLLHDDGWQEAVEGATYVLHLASPFPASDPKDRKRPDHPRARRHPSSPARSEEVVFLQSSRCDKLRRSDCLWQESRRMASRTMSVTGQTSTRWRKCVCKVKDACRAGSLEVCRERRRSWAGVGDGESRGGVWATDAARGQFDDVQHDPDDSTGKVSVVPHVAFGCVDVRDVAALHLLVMTKPEASGQRYLANGSSRSRTSRNLHGSAIRIGGRGGKGTDERGAGLDRPHWRILSPLLKAAATSWAGMRRSATKRPLHWVEAALARRGRRGHGQTFIDKRESRL
ncbi:hypothetical protein L7F22_043109 [Adiantum nelumboides]|nr:hypothetical protein [Adiantum nelumboides]